jgi:hypothetical protein
MIDTLYILLFKNIYLIYYNLLLYCSILFSDESLIDDTFFLHIDDL